MATSHIPTFRVALNYALEHCDIIDLKKISINILYLKKNQQYTCLMSSLLLVSLNNMLRFK